ncbi:uncharacterized protein LOC116146289 [Pistacia vera]|uniref:uncharacterized protein LOC116146289 n=1 Tax=Pistacia vera TaxID=55513 RepID=UPI0012639FC4|nr:uncharacterized protein LOC116146289 [Pistacia vera]
MMLRCSSSLRLSFIRCVRNQFSAADPQLKCSNDIALFATHRDRRKFMHFMMPLCEDFESTRASLLHRTPLPTLETAVAELIFEENHHSTMKMQTPDSVVAAIPQTIFGSSPASGHFPSQSSKIVFYKYCKHPSHSVTECQKLQNKNQSRAPLLQVAVVAPIAPFAAEPSSVSITLTTIDIETLIHQDPQTGQLIGIGRKIGRLFELTSLQLPSHLSRSIVAPAIFSQLWHSQLGHASIPRVCLLASQGHLGSIGFESFDYASY